jgi:hypothetical protein
LDRSSYLRQLHVGRDEAAHPLRHRLDDVVHVVALDQQRQRDARHVLPQPGDLAEHLGISHRPIADGEDHQIHAPKQSGRVEQTRDIATATSRRSGNAF